MNHFKLDDDNANANAVLIAGGIGITPIKPMAQVLKARGVNLRIHYAGRSRAAMAFTDRLEREFKDHITFYSAEDSERMDLEKILSDAEESTVFYVCGPNRMLDALVDKAEKLGIDENRIRFERFTAKPIMDAKPIALMLKRSNLQIRVMEDQSVLDAVIDAGVSVPFSCKTGQCKTCAVPVLEGEPLHLDDALSDTEKKDHQLMCPCVSRAVTDNLTLDI